METDWTITDQGVFSTPGASLLIFHDQYPEGHQGGLELILHGQRIITNGDLRMNPTPGQWEELPEVGQRILDMDKQEVQIPLKFTHLDLAYSINIRPHGEALCIDINLTEPFPERLTGRLGFNLELFPPLLFGKSYQLGESFGILPRQGNGPIEVDSHNMLNPVPLASGTKFIVSPEDPDTYLDIERLDGDLQLYDGRDTSPNGWFVLRAPVIPGTQTGAIRLLLTPHRIPGWKRTPVMLYSQVGYHPSAEKRLLVELDPATTISVPVELERLDGDANWVPVCAGSLTPWGKFLCYQYASFDFSPVKTPGLYHFRLGDEVSAPFPIAQDIYQRGVWQPTLDTHLPVQMCHVKVVEGLRIWHGACHLDDALVAPLNTEHFDSYRQRTETETPYAPLEHVPFLDRGGWHDAGDFDLAAGSQASTTFVLALVREVFRLDRDQTTVRAEDRLVLLHQPDGIPDLVQQVAHGVENLLSGYRAARARGDSGHSYIGIIEDTLDRYALLGDTASMTDNRIYDPKLSANEVIGDRSGIEDDRWVFTNRNTALEYQVITALAASSRVLKGWEDKLSQECLSTALQAWDVEQQRAVADLPNCYVPGNPDVQQVLAAVELLLTTGDKKFAEKINHLFPVISTNISQTGWAVSRIHHLIQDDEFSNKFRKVLVDYSHELEGELARNPFGIPFHPQVWGEGWKIQWHAVRYFFLHQAFPDIFEPEPIQRALNYMLGNHPASNTSLVSGVGGHSLTVAYGTNRAEWSYIPGGVASGPNLIRPDFPELKEPYPYIWQQAEYVIGGAATYIFLVLAVDRLLNP